MSTAFDKKFYQMITILILQEATLLNLDRFEVGNSGNTEIDFKAPGRACNGLEWWGLYTCLSYGEILMAGLTERI